MQSHPPCLTKCRNPSAAIKGCSQKAKPENDAPVKENALIISHIACGYLRSRLRPNGLRLHLCIDRCVCRNAVLCLCVNAFRCHVYLGVAASTSISMSMSAALGRSWPAVWLCECVHSRAPVPFVYLCRILYCPFLLTDDSVAPSRYDSATSIADNPSILMHVIQHHATLENHGNASGAQTKPPEGRKKEQETIF